MKEIRSLLAPGLNGVPEWAIFFALLAVSLLLIFAGRTIVKVIALFVVGLIGASIGGMLGAQVLGNFGSLLGIILGFVIGGLLGVALVAVGIGLAVGYGAYLLTLDLVSSTTAAIVVGTVFFVIGVALYGKILALVTALAGGLLLFDVLRIYGLGLAFSAILAATATLIGIWVSYGPARRVSHPAAPSPGSRKDNQG